MSAAAAEAPLQVEAEMLRILCNRANMTMGMDMSPLFSEVVACMSIQVLEIKKMVCQRDYGPFWMQSDHSPVLSRCIFTSVSNSRSFPMQSSLTRNTWSSLSSQLRSKQARHDEIHNGWLLGCEMIYLYLPKAPTNAATLQDSNDRNPLIRALAIRTMSYIQVPSVSASYQCYMLYYHQKNMF